MQRSAHLSRGVEYIRTQLTRVMRTRREHQTRDVTVSLTADVLLEASPAEVWKVATDWERQSSWMLMTSVRSTGVHDPGSAMRFRPSRGWVESVSSTRCK